MTVTELYPEIRKMVSYKFPYTRGTVSHDDLAQAGAEKILEAGYTEIDRRLGLTIAHRGAVDELRRQLGRTDRNDGESPRPELVELEDHHAVASHDEIIFAHLEKRERLDIIADLLPKLSPQQHYVLARRFWGELTLAQIGEEMDRSEARIHQHQRAGLDRLRTLLVAKGFA